MGLGDKNQQLVVQGRHVDGQPIDQSIEEFSFKSAVEPNLEHINPKQKLLDLNLPLVDHVELQQMEHQWTAQAQRKPG